MRMVLHNRKILYLFLCIVVICVFSLSIAYAALFAVLNISGNADIVASTWAIHLDNVIVTKNSVDADSPRFLSNNSLEFDVTLNMPGDFYEFTVDVVNDGTIDAMIDSVTKTPTLTSEQSKYLDYVIEYRNGESIETKQLIKAGSYVKLRVKIEYRKDIDVSSLPTNSTVLDLSLTVNYIQSDDSYVNVNNNGLILPEILSGSLDEVGSEISIGNENFYLISSDDANVTLLSKYNLYVGGVYSNGWTAYGLEATGIQNSTMLGWSPSSPYKGVLKFAEKAYWNDFVSGYPADVYDSNSNLYSYVDNYKSYLESFGAKIVEARLIKGDELVKLGCSYSDSKCNNAPKWVYSSSYWTASAIDSSNIRYINVWGGFVYRGCVNADYFGIRPVITISKDYF